MAELHAALTALADEKAALADEVATVRERCALLEGALVAVQEKLHAAQAGGADKAEEFKALCANLESVVQVSPFTDQTIFCALQVALAMTTACHL